MLNKFAFVILAAGLGLNAVGASAADPTEREYTVKDEMTRSECGDCHMVFPPNRLTVGGWKKIMANLSNHFGEDASLDGKSVKHIERYLISKAMDARDTVPSRMMVKQWAKKGLVDPIRITETPGWTRHHRSKKYRLMSEDVGYKKGSNCIVCHKQAERGMYEEFPGMYGSSKTE